MSFQYEQKCETKYDTQCNTVYETEYDQQCRTEYRTEYDTVYEVSLINRFPFFLFAKMFSFFPPTLIGRFAVF